MGKTGYKRITIAYTLIFVILFAAGYGYFFASGRTFITKRDGIDQYYMGFLYFGRYLRELFGGLFTGSPSFPLYDLSIGMGEDIIGSLNYYGFGDPLYLIAVFAKGPAGPFIYSMSFFLRLYGAGLSFLFYCRQMRLKPVCALAGVFCYIVNGFTYGGVSSYMGWGSVLIYLPLMLVGVERIFRGERRGRTIMLLSAVYASLCGFYFLYMSCVFLVVYCIGRGLCIFGLSGLKKIILKSLAAAGMLILGIMLAAPVFFPSVAGFMGSERAHISALDIILSPASWKPYLPVYRSFVNDPARYYFKYICRITVAEYAALALAFFIPRSKRKLQLCTANIVILAVVALPITGYIFSAFGESGFEVNVRWAFLIHFIFALTLVCVLDALPFGRLSWPGSGTAGPYTALAVVLVSTALVIHGNVSSGGGRLDIDNVNRNLDSPVLYSKVIAADRDVFRISLDRFMTTSDRPENSAMIHGYYGITYWLSIMNNYTQLASDELSGEHQEWRSDGFSHVGEYETAMGVKYYVARAQSTPPEGYEAVETFDYYNDEWVVYRNTSWHGMARCEDISHAGKLWDEKASYRAYFSAINEAALEDSGIESLYYDNRRNILTVKTSPSSADMLVVPIPFSTGWSVYVDGIRASSEVRELMCTAVDTGGGGHEVVFVYHSRGFETGLLIMAVAILLCLGYAVTERLRRKRPPFAG